MKQLNLSDTAFAKNSAEYKNDSLLKLVSLFSGCGGMDIGFEGDFTCLKRSINSAMHPTWIHEEDGEYVKVVPTRFKTIFANDIREDAKSAWVSYFKKKNSYANQLYHVESIVNLVKQEINGNSIFPKEVDVVIGGFPCQDFSVAGKRQGLNSQKSHTGAKITSEELTIENRGHLYVWMREVISLTQPKLFVAENVKGLTNLENAQKTIENDFSNAANGGYLVVPARVLHAADYGVPQARERVIFFGFKKSALRSEALMALSQKNIPAEYDPYPPQTHSETDKRLKQYVTCAEAFTGIEEPNESEDISQQKYSKAKFMGKHCQGQTEIKTDSISPTIRSEHHGNIEFRRLSFENGGQHIEELAQGLAERRLTVRECARIQTFPDDYQFILPKTAENVSVNASNAYKLIGNAVPCVLAYNIAMHLSEKWNDYFSL